MKNSNNNNNNCKLIVHGTIFANTGGSQFSLCVRKLNETCFAIHTLDKCHTRNHDN